MHPEVEPKYSKQRLIFRPKSLLLGWWGGCISPIPPPKSATGCSISITTIVSTVLASDEIDSIKYLTYTNYGHRATYCSRLKVSCAQ